MEQTYNLPQNGKERVVIVGAGFAGLKLARLLSRSKYQVVVVDKRNFHQFQPLFYQVATAALEPSSISFPVRKVFHGNNNLHFRNTELVEIRSEENIIVTKAGKIEYDHLVLANGVSSNYFGNKNIEKYSLPMKSTSEALYLRNRILDAFERAILTDDKTEQEKLLSIIVVGGGPTGVELSGAIAELKSLILPKDYPELDFSQMRIRLLEGSPRLLNGMTEKSGNDAVRFLEKLGVEVQLNTLIENYDGENVYIKGQEEPIKCMNLIWAAGVAGQKINGLNAEQYGRAGRIKVDGLNRVEGSQNIYAIGDIAYMETETYPNGHPQVAQVAIQQGVNLAKNLKGNTDKNFEYYDKGSMATIGRNMAVVDIPKPKIQIAGFIAWIMWLIVHLVAIVGVKNRIIILMNWAHSYFWSDQSLRILVRPFRKSFNSGEEAGEFLDL